MKRVQVFAAICCITAVPGAGFAEEQIRPLAASGHWIAAAHFESMTAPPDVCIVYNAQHNVAFRADSDGVEFRVTNERWSLPAGVAGGVTLAVGTVSRDYLIAANTDTRITMRVPREDQAVIFAAMDKASAMSVKVGNAKPIVVSLAGSTKATNAFRTCAGINSNAQSPGSNPFQ